MNFKRFLILIPLVGLLSATGLMAQHGRYLNESRNPAIGDPAAIAAGAKLWATSCAGCHGPDGSGGRGPNLVKRSVWHPLGDETIFKTIREGAPGTDMPPTKLTDAETWQLVAFVKAQTGPASGNNVPGDPDAGRRVFFDAKTGCSTCHSIRGEGGRMGPDLSDVGGSLPMALIKEAIIEPSKGLSRYGQEGVIVKLKDGKQIQGVARNRDNYSMQVLDAKGDLHLISMLNVDQLTISANSPMPGDYGQRLSKQELQDLVAYLAHQTVRPLAPAGRKP